jgi:E3 ubiquitin-protein ligase HUWE1
LPGAIGALCLNQAGLDQLAQRPTIIPRIFSILTSDRHVKTLQEKDNATYIGASIDELIRHHPSIKTPVFDAIKSTLQRIEDLGNEFVIPKAEMGSYGLRAIAPNGQDLELTVEEPALTISQPELTTSGQTTPGAGLPQAEDGESASSEEGNNLIVTYIDNMGRVSVVQLLTYLPLYFSTDFSHKLVPGGFVSAYCPL